MKLLLAPTMLACLLSFASLAQVSEFYVGLSGSMLKGDINQWHYRPSPAQVLDLRPGFQIGMSSTPKQAFTYRLQLAAMGLASKPNHRTLNSGSFFNPDPYRASILQMGALVDYNFLNYQYLPQKRDWTPYLVLGLELSRINAELGGASAYQDSFTSLSLPYGLGLKYEFNRRFGLRVEAVARKIFSDNLDGFRTDTQSIAPPSGFDLDLSRTDQWVQLSVSLTYHLYPIFCPSF